MVLKHQSRRNFLPFPRTMPKLSRSAAASRPLDSKVCIRGARHADRLRIAANLAATGLVIQMSRGPKLATTKETELTPEQKAECGNIQISGRLSFVATLFSSRPERPRASRTKVSPSVLAPRQILAQASARSRGSFVRRQHLRFRRWRRSQCRAARHAALDPKKHDGLPVVLSLTLSARALQPDADDDDDAQSTSSALTGFDAGEVVGGQRGDSA